MRAKEATASESVIRYVITHVNKDGVRTLFDPCQGRYTYATIERAQARLNALTTANDLARYIPFPMSLEVRAVDCWPNHFDPKGVWFDTEESDKKEQGTYGNPTYLQYDNPEYQWLEWKRQADGLAIAELERHASVSTSNRHRCRNCFCCAALEVLEEKRAKEMEGWKHNG